MYMEMNNQEKLAQCYTDVLTTLYDYTGELVESTNDIATNDIIDIIDRLTTNLKRIGETQIIEVVEHDLEPKEDKIIEEEGDKE